MSRYAHLPYRQGVGMMVLDGEGRVFVGKRIDMVSEAWQMPQGGIDDGEEPREAALRELAEETGMVSVEFLDGTDAPLPYDLPDELVPKIWKGKYRGQLQHWFALRFTGEESEIDLNAHEPPELSEYRWVAMDSLPELIVPFKRALYVQLVSRFRKFAT
ncbi:MAG: RNA pyrophosphohydrolase [Alphaproteobacteria bacterium]